ncbi:MAG: NAD-dependent epimerase/dehydratase family protein [Rhizobium sp.]|nr:NAD-dependent epimerase/dehydratase family protein [Rhizobium sp.]
MKRSIHILGGRGFIGARLAAQLAAAGHRVSVSGRSRATDGRARVAEFDALLSSHDWFVHCASDSTPASTANLPLAELERNLHTLVSLVDAAQRHPATRILYLSSAGTTYANDVTGRPQESSALAPRSYHGAAKVAAESFLQALCASNDRQVVVLRPSNVYGPGQTPRPGFGLVATALARIRDGGTLSVFGDGSSTRDYLYVDDLVELVTRIVDSTLQPGLEVFNASHGQGYTLLEVLDIVDAITGFTLARQFQPARAVDALCIVPDPGRATARFGWKARTDLPEGVALTWNWIQSLPS